MPKVSIVTALHDRTRYLRPRVESIFAQTMRDFEWIVIDDHSSDDTFERFWRLTRSDPRVLVLRNAANLGQGPTTKKAWDLARGEYVYITDDDDTCAPAFLERMCGVLDAHPNVGLAYCRHLFMDARGGTWSGLPRFGRSYVRSGEAEFRDLLRACYIQPPCSIVRREAAERAAVFRTFVPPSYVDYHSYLKVCLISDVAYLAEPLASYRLHPARTSRTKFAAAGFVQRQERDSFDLVEDVFVHLPDNRRGLERLKTQALWYAAESLRPTFRFVRERGVIDTALALKAVVRRRVPHYPIARFDPGPVLGARTALREAALRVARRATYAAAENDGRGESEATPASRPSRRPPVPVRSISVVVCVRDQAQALHACLARLTRARMPEDCKVEIVVVDNGSRDDATRVVERYARSSPIPVRYVREPVPGVSRARNRGLATSTGEVIASIDADCLVAEDWLVRLLEEFEADPWVHVLGGRVELHDRRDRKVTVKGAKQHQLLTRARQLDGFLHGCNLAFRRNLVKRIGAYDVRLGKGAPVPSAEDADLVYRAFRAGLKVVYSPHPLVFHNHGRRTAEAEAELRRSYRIGTGAVRTKHILAGDGAMAAHALRDTGRRLLTVLGTSLRSPAAAGRQLRELAHYLVGAGAYLRHRQRKGGAAEAASTQASQSTRGAWSRSSTSTSSS